MSEEYRTVAKCEEIHAEVRRWGKWLIGLLVSLIAIVGIAAQQGWSASSKAESLGVEVRANGRDVKTNYDNLEKSLESIQTDVREIRATQRELLRSGHGE